MFRARFGNSKAALERPARNRGFPASELFFRPDRGRLTRGMNSRRECVSCGRFVSPPPDGESSVKSIWGTRIRLAASPSHDKIPCRCITNGGDGGTAGNALARGYAPAWSVGLFLFRLGRPPTHSSLITHRSLLTRCEKGDASLLGSGELVALGCCGQI